MLRLSPDVQLPAELFLNASTVILSFLVDLPASCSSLYNRETSTYAYFAQTLLKLDSAQNSTEYFTTGQLELMLQQLASSYIPGTGVLDLGAVTNAADRQEYVEMTCDFQSIRVRLIS